MYNRTAVSLCLCTNMCKDNKELKSDGYPFLSEITAQINASATLKTTTHLHFNEKRHRQSPTQWQQHARTSESVTRPSPALHHRGNVLHFDWLHFSKVNTHARFTGILGLQKKATRAENGNSWMHEDNENNRSSVHHTIDAVTNLTCTVCFHFKEISILKFLTILLLMCLTSHTNILFVGNQPPRMCWKEPWLKASNKQNNRATAKPEYGKKEARLKPDVVNKFNLSFLKFVRCKVNIQVIIFNLHF